jgi:CheY-like chemotaxis protein
MIETHRIPQPLPIDLGEILLVEDEPADAELIQRALRSAGLVNPIRVLSDGEAALDFLLGRELYADRESYPLPQLVLLDLKLPKVSGLDVLEKVKSSDVVRRIPIVVLTSSTQSEDVNHAYDRGANSYLVKPVRFADFAKVAAEIKLYWTLLNTPPELAE